MVELDKLRVTKLKCLSCGCRDKRVALLNSKIRSYKRIGFITICCNCGETRTYLKNNMRKEDDYCNNDCCNCDSYCKDNRNNIESRKELLNVQNVDVMDYLNGQYEVSDIICAIPDPYCPKKDCPLYQTKPSRELTLSDLYTREFTTSIYETPHIESKSLKLDEVEGKKKFL